MPDFKQSVEKEPAVIRQIMRTTRRHQPRDRIQLPALRLTKRVRSQNATLEKHGFWNVVLGVHFLMAVFPSPDNPMDPLPCPKKMFIRRPRLEKGVHPATHTVMCHRLARKPNTTTRNTTTTHTMRLSLH